MKHLLLCLLGLSASCSVASSATSADTPLAAGWSGELSQAECERRAEAMAQQSESMRQGPHEIVRDTQDTAPGWSGQNDPCRREPRPTQADLEQRTLSQAKLQARAFLTQGQHDAALEALTPAYSEGLEADEELDQLTKEAVLSWEELPQRARQEMPYAKAECVLGRRQGGEFREVALWPKEEPLLAACGLPQGLKGAPEEAELVLMVRRRLGAGRFTLVRTKGLGKTREVAKDGLVEVPLGAMSPEELGGRTRVYLDVTLVDTRPGQPERVVGRSGIFLIP